MLVELMNQDGPYADIEIMKIVNQRKKALLLLEEKQKGEGLSEPAKAMTMENGKTMLIAQEKMKIENKILFNKEYLVIAPETLKNSYKNIPDLKQKIDPEMEIFTNKNITVTISFHLHRRRSSSEMLQLLKEAYVSTIETVEADELYAGKIQDDILIPEDEESLTWYYECINNTPIEKKMYNLLWFVGLGSDMIIGIFSCPETAKKYWREAAFGIMNSLNKNTFENRKVRIRA